MHVRRRLPAAVLGALFLFAHAFVGDAQSRASAVPVLLERKEVAPPMLLRGRPRGDLVFLIQAKLSADGGVASADPVGCVAPAILGEARASVNAVRSWRFRPTGRSDETVLVGVNWARPANRETVDGAAPAVVAGRPARPVLDAPAVHPGTFAPAPGKSSVRVELTVDETGIPVDAVPLDPVSPLTAAALDAALRWRFKPSAAASRRRIQVTVPVVETPSFGPPRWEWKASTSGCAGGEDAGVVPPRAIRAANPSYTREAMQAKQQGIVIVEALLGEDGAMLAGRITRSLPLLDRSALECARRWQFTPRLVDGVPTPTVITIELNFALK
jgi:TonB family protein